MTSEEVRPTNANFNYNKTHIIFWTNEEIKMFSLEDFRTIYVTPLKHSYLVEQPYETNYLCVVTKPSPQIMKIVDMKSDRTSIKEFTSDVFSIKSNKSVMLVGCRDCIYVYRTQLMKGVCKIELLNITGLMAISQHSESENCMAIPSSENVGVIEIIDVIARSEVTKIRAHNNAIATISFHPSEPVMATASKKGTVIRLISIPNGNNLYEFRRGLQRNAEIYSLSFGLGSNYLISSGSTGTVHIFKYNLPWEKTEKNGWSQYISGTIKSTANYLMAPSADLSVKPSHGWASYIGGVISSSANFVPKHLYEVCTQTRSCLKIRHVNATLKNIATVTKINGISKIVVFTEDGSLSIYSIEGDECKMRTMYSLITGKTSFEIQDELSTE